MSKEISQDTSIEITWGAIIFVISVALGVGVWMTTLEVQGTQLRKDIDRLQNLESRLSRIETLLELLLKNKQKEN
jgi:hypothetical protein